MPKHSHDLRFIITYSSLGPDLNLKVLTPFSELCFLTCNDITMFEVLESNFKTAKFLGGVAGWICDWSGGGDGYSLYFVAE